MEWPIDSRNNMEEMARQDPYRLQKWIDSGSLGPGCITFALEYLGRHGGHRFEEYLIGKTNDASPLIREGAVYGLGHITTKRVIERLSNMEQEDPSPGVRLSVRNALEEIRYLKEESLE